MLGQFHHAVLHDVQRSFLVTHVVHTAFEGAALHTFKDHVIFERNEPGSSLFSIALGSVLVQIDKDDASRTVPRDLGRR